MSVVDWLINGAVFAMSYYAAKSLFGNEIESLLSKKA